MLSKSRRVDTSLFEELMKAGKGANSGSLSAKYLKKDGQKSRFSFVISGKVEKTAVIRNLFKRRGRSIIKKHIGEIKDGYWVAFFAKKGAEKLSFAKLEAEILEILSKTQIIHPVK